MKKMKIAIIIVLISSILFLIYSVFSYSSSLSIDNEVSERLKKFKEEYVIEDESLLKEKEIINVENKKIKVIQSRKYKHDELFLKNSDYLGWLYIPNTKIDYPVTEGEKYLKLGFDKKMNIEGNPYIVEGYDEKQNYLVIFGHNMGHGSNNMFSTIANFKEKNFYEKNKTLYFNEINSIKNGKSPRYKIIGFMEFDYKKEINEKTGYDYVKTDFKDSEEFDNYIIETIKRLKYYSNDFTKLKFNKQRLLVVSTCDTDFLGRTDYKRLVLFAIIN